MNIMAPLKRISTRPPACLSFGDDTTLVLRRAHELCGPSRHAAALALAMRSTGPVAWIRSQARIRTQLSSDAVARWINPGRLLLIDAAREEDIFWATEEVLRDGAVPLVITEPPRLPALTPVRRLHLAAEAAPGPTTALILSPGDGGAQGVETRWHMTPAPAWATDTQGLAWTLTRRRARMAPPKSWRLRRHKGQVTLSEPGDDPAPRRAANLPLTRPEPAA